MKRSHIPVAGICAGFLVAAHAFAACPGGTYCASIQAPASLANFCGGTVPVTVTNTGTLTWPAGGAYPVHLAYHWLQGAITVVVAGTRTVLPSNVAPGASISLSAQVTRPPSGAAGAYTLQFDMVQENVTWFATQGSPVANVKVSVPQLTACMQVPQMPRGFSPQPKIASCDVPPAATPWPGSAIHCTGSGFGDTPGRVMMNGLKTWNGTPSDIKLTTDRNSWTDGQFIAYVPDGLSGFRSQSVTIQVWVQGGNSSNQIPGTFQPTIDTEPVVSSSIGSTCPGHNIENECSCGSDPAYSGYCGGFHHGYVTFGFVNGDKGTDRWTSTLVLRNDWVFGISFSPDPDWPQQTWVAGFTPNKATFGLSVGWTYDFGSQYAGISYDLQVYREGPLGVPWQ